jgi:hypothetical protein
VRKLDFNSPTVPKPCISSTVGSRTKRMARLRK